METRYPYTYTCVHVEGIREGGRFARGGWNGMKIDFCKASVITMTDPIRGNEVLGVA